MGGTLALLAASTVLSRVALPDILVAHTDFDPNPAEAGFRFASDGGIDKDQGGAFSDIQDWLLSGAVADYEIRVDTTTGSLTSGTTGSWLALSSTRTWTLVQSTPGVQTWTGTVKIRDAGTLEVLANGTAELTAEQDV